MPGQQHGLGARARHVARPRVALALVVLALAVFGPAAAAQANTIAAKNFRVQPKGTVGTGVPVIVSGSGTFDGYPLDPASCVLTVDGAVVPRSAYVATFASGRNLYLYWVPAPALADGLRTVSVSVADTAGKQSSVSWGFTVAQKPTGTFTAPDAATPNYDGRPVIGLAVSDNTPGPGLAVTGQVHAGDATGEVVATFGGAGLSGGQQVFTLPGELVPGPYTLTADVTDAAGLAFAVPARHFEVVSAEPMSVFTAECTGCHESTGHPATGIPCAECHLSVYHNYADCGDCHEPHTGPVTVSSSCRSCHDKDGAPKHTKDSVAPSHLSACDGCHNESLLERHSMAPEGSAYSFQCGTCHESEDAAVVAAIQSGDTSCGACHAGGHEPVHTLPRTDGCATCHPGESLTTVHMGAEGFTCGSCHESADPEVVAAIASNTLACSACHVTAGVDYHPDMTAAHTAPLSDYYTCSGCHHSWGSNPTSGHDITRHAAGCVTCHNPSIDLTGKTARCESCHLTEGAGTPPEGYHVNTIANHTPTSAASLDCIRCHEAADVRGIHVTNGCDTCHKAVCGDCHGLHNTGMGPALTLGVECARCHAVQGTNYHVEFDAKHASAAASCLGADCHVASLVDTHSAYVGEGSRNPEYSDTCALCHLNSDPDRIPAGATSDCGSCHSSLDHETLHAVTLSDDCSGCHSDTSLTSFHAAIGCSGCHSSTDPVVVAAIAASDKSCATCHGSQPHPDIVATHASTVTSGPMNVFDYHEGYSPLTWQVDCTLCHASTNLVAAHGQSCALCHSGSNPAGSIDVWNKTCQQSSCHPTIQHPSADSAHNSFDCESACHESDWSVYYSSCDWCHNAAASAPVTASDVRATYVGSASIHFTVPNLTWTYYRLDGGARVAAQSLTVPAPASGSASHTIEYWSANDSGYEELPHKTATFTVSADAQPPVTSATILASYIGPISIQLTPSDDGSAPIQGTYWILDASARMSGTTVNVPQPVSGSQGHTLEYWSVDASGNEELPHHVANFTITADVLAPTGSITINAGAAYTTSAWVTLTLSAADIGGSGVSQMRFSYNNTNWSGWENYATTKGAYNIYSPQGSRTVWVQYRDVAGNVSTFTDTIVYDGSGPGGSMSINGGAASTFTPSVTLNISVSDSISGLAGMRFSNDNVTWSAWEQNASTKAWTLAPGAGSRIVYAQFRDSAGNTSMTSDTITVLADTTPPTGSISVNGGAATAESANVTLSLAAADTGGSGVVDMQFSNDNAAWSSWEPYATTKSWTLALGDGAKTIYVHFRDAQGNVATYSDGITLTTADTTSPSGSITINGGDTTTAGTGVTIAVSASDVGGSGLAQMQFSNDGASWSSWETYATSKTWVLTAGEGPKTVYARFRDGAANVSDPCSDGIELVTAPTATLAFVWPSYGYAQLHVEDAYGNTIASTTVSGSDLNWYVTVPAGAEYYLVCDHYDDWEYGGQGGGYGTWSNDPELDADGILSPGETVVWNY